jgi:hypothetical protein
MEEAAMKLACLRCGVHVEGREAIEGHVRWHRLVGEPVRVWWCGANRLVIRAEA